MGGVVSSIFGGGAPKEPDIPAMPAREDTQEAESRASRDEEMRKARARRGMAGTILTSPLGASGQPQSGGLLGRSIGK